MMRIKAVVQGFILGCGLAAGCGAAMADAPDQAPTTGQMVQQLTPKHASRGLVIGGAGAVAPAVAPAINLAVNFEYRSARLATDAELLLDRLGAALKDPALRGDRFGIAGHTDAVGGADYNRRLSERRAAAVRDYLVKHHGIAAARLSITGYGSSRLLDPAHPNSGVNRRVEISNLGGGGCFPCAARARFAPRLPARSPLYRCCRCRAWRRA
jgi:outer membrane protein OmpA-like peptidoglycan-associated protein